MSNLEFRKRLGANLDLAALWFGFAVVIAASQDSMATDLEYKSSKTGLT